MLFFSPPFSLLQVSERNRTAGYSDLSMKTSWRGFGENTGVYEAPALDWDHCFRGEWPTALTLVSSRKAHLCAPTHTHTRARTHTHAQPLCPHSDGDPWMGPKHIIIFIMWLSQHQRQLQHTRHAGSWVPVTLATSHSSADVSSSGPFILLLGLFVSVCVCLCISLCVPAC